MVVTGGKRTVRGSCGKLEVIQFLLFEFLAKADIKVPSRFMRKFICRLRLNEVSRQ